MFGCKPEKKATPRRGGSSRSRKYKQIFGKLYVLLSYKMFTVAHEKRFRDGPEPC